MPRSSTKNKPAHMIREEYSRRIKTNPKYSMASFAKELGVSAPYLGRLVSGQRHVPAGRAADLASRMGFDQSMTVRFVAEARLLSARGPASRSYARAEVASARGDIDFSLIDKDSAHVLSRWYHAAIAELTTLSDFNADPQWIARRLRITPMEAELALGRLLRIGMLRRMDSGRFVLSEPAFSTGDFTSQAIRSYHVQCIDLAQRALSVQAPEHRDITGLTVAINSTRLADARALIRQFTRQISDLVNDVPRCDAIYQFNVQFFRLDEPGAKS